MSGDIYFGLTDSTRYADLAKNGGFPDDETEGVMYVSPTGDNTWSGASPRAPRKTIESAVVKAGTSWRGRVMLARGTHEVGDGMDLTGYAAQLAGCGPDTVVKASSQVGSVLKFSNSISVGSSLGVPTFGGFTIQGSGVAGPDKHGIEIIGGGGMHWKDVAIVGTGGVPLKLLNVTLSMFDNFIFGQPVNAFANDVPYFRGDGFTNGNRFIGFGFRSVSSTNPEAPSGVVVLQDDGSFAPEWNKLDAWWFEFMHIPTNGCLISLAGSCNTISDLQIFDSAKVAGATGTAHIRFRSASVGDFGGNTIRGFIPGKGTGATSIDAGVVCTQSRNSIVGTKGYNGTNVVLEAGCDYTTVILHGGNSGVAGAAGWIDNSAAAHNTLIDYMNGTMQVSGFVIEQVADGKLLIRPRGAATTITQLQLGVGGPTILATQAALGRTFVRGDLGMQVQTADGSVTAFEVGTNSTSTAARATATNPTHQAFTAKGAASHNTAVPVADVQANDGTSLFAVLPGSTRIAGDLAHTGTKSGVNGATPVVRAAAIAAPAGGTTVDVEARAALAAALTAIKNFGITA